MTRCSSLLAHHRLVADQLLRPVAEDRARLSIASDQLERAGRNALAVALSARVKSQPLLMPVLQALIRQPG